MAGFPFYGRIVLRLFSPSVGKHLGYFHVLVILNNTAVNMEFQESFQESDFISLDKYSSPPLSKGDIFQDPPGCLNP